MVKDSDGRSASVGIHFFCSQLEEREDMKKESKKAVIAYRKTCPAKGTGLSHYILMDKKAK